MTRFLPLLFLVSSPAFASGSQTGLTVVGELLQNQNSDDAFDDTHVYLHDIDTGVVGAGVEVELGVGLIEMDFAPDGQSVVVRASGWFAPHPFNGLRAEFDHPTAYSLTDISVVSDTFGGITPDRVAFDGTRFSVNFNGLSGHGEVELLLPNDGSDTPYISFRGTCPGTISVAMGDMTRGGRVGVIHSDSLGFSPLPVPVCRTPTRLNNPELLALVRLDGAGQRILAAPVSRNMCGRYVQVVDPATCRMSPPVQLP